jgi:hypothetical protein
LQVCVNNYFKSEKNVNAGLFSDEVFHPVDLEADFVLFKVNDFIILS